MGAMVAWWLAYQATGFTNSILLTITLLFSYLVLLRDFLFGRTQEIRTPFEAHPRVLTLRRSLC